MSFENPQILSNSGHEEENEEKAESSLGGPSKIEKLKRGAKKIAALTGLGATLLSTEGCADNNKESKLPPKGPDPIVRKESVHPETRKSRIRENYELRKKQSNYETKTINDNQEIVRQAGGLEKLNLSTNLLLKYYYQGLNGDRSERLFQEGQLMRVLEIAQKKGINLKLSERSKIEIDGGVVPLSAKIDGISIPITKSDYTAKELEIIKFQEGVKNFQPDNSDNSNSSEKRAPKNIRGSKPIDFENL